MDACPPRLSSVNSDSSDARWAGNIGGTTVAATVVLAGPAGVNIRCGDCGRALDGYRALAVATAAGTCCTDCAGQFFQAPYEALFETAHQAHRRHQDHVARSVPPGRPCRWARWAALHTDRGEAEVVACEAPGCLVRDGVPLCEAHDDAAAAVRTWRRRALAP